MIRKRLSTTVRCVPRFGYDHAEVREINIDVENVHDDDEIRTMIQQWFAVRGIEDALFDLDCDDNGYFAIVNDEAFEAKWGTALL